ncbi:MAG: DUF177 domain-containing protein [Xanthomonadaceae bacterium]|nr:DUF177 domain-containing protein [Xanthomonadaceae bacterium]
MKIHLSEIKEEGQDYKFTDQDTWLTQALSSLDESDTELNRLKPPVTTALKARPTAVNLNLCKIDGVVIARGDYGTELSLLCSRCAKLFTYGLKGKVYDLYTRNREFAGEKNGGVTGTAKSIHREEDENSPEITYLNQEWIDLSEVLTEQWVLQIPLQPLCKSDCKGICQNCGSDLNVGRCACAKIQTTNSFSVLKDFKGKRI